MTDMLEVPHKHIHNEKKSSNNHLFVIKTDLPKTKEETRLYPKAV